MAGLTHSALRTTILGFGGIGLLSTEMLAAARLPAESARTSPYLVRTARETPLSYQLLLTGDQHIPRIFAALQPFLGADLRARCPLAFETGLEIAHDADPDSTLREGMTRAAYHSWRPLADAAR